MTTLRDPILGIDLGTSNAVVAHADGTGPVQVLADDNGYKVLPSVVSFHPSGGVVVGAAAKQRKVIDPQNTIYSVKRLIGRGYHSPEVQTAKARVPFQIKEGPNQLPMIATRGGEFAIPEISAIVLDYLRALATARLGTEVSRAVITVPASFNDAQRSATATAGAIAGITVVRVLNEPTAAALAYGHAHALQDVIAVYDFGGGTFDVSILKLDDQVYEVLGTAGDTFLGGDDLDERLVDKMVAKFLGEHGIDLRSNEVAMMRLRAVAEQTKIELSRRSRAVVRIDEIAYDPRGAPLHFQIEISRDEFVREVADVIERTFPVCREALQLAGVAVDQISDVLLVGGTTKIPAVREQVGRFFQKPPRTDVGAEDAIAIGAALQAASLERILARPRGGTRPLPDDERPPLPRRPEETTTATAAPIDPEAGGEPTLTAPAAERSIPRGGTQDTSEGLEPTPAATPAKTLLGVPRAAIPRLDSTIPPPSPPPLPRAALPAATRAPAERPPAAASSTLDIPTLQPAATAPGRGERATPPPLPGAARTSSATPNTPTLVAAAPAPPAAGTAKGFASPPAIADREPPPPVPPAPPPRPPVVLEVTPRGLGIGTVAGYCEELIRRNSRLPAAMKKLFTTSRDRQDVVRIVVCQGESRRLDHNVVIGDLVLQGLPPRPRGETSIEVTFELDASGILQVQARDALTGVEQRAELDLRGGMQQHEITASRDRLQLLRR